MTQTVTAKRVLLKDMQGNYLIPYTDTGVGDPDEVTIHANENKQLVAVGTKTIQDENNYIWFGTQEEYDAGMVNGTIQADWTCYITDNSGPDVIDVIRQSTLCNPFSLLDERHSDSVVYNGSWLRSNAQWNSRSLYQDAYDALIAETMSTIEVGTPNEKGYIKRGLSVKFSTESYGDYDFVVNQVNKTFRLPIKSHLKTEAQSGTVYLYYYVGAVITDVNVIAGEQVLTRLDQEICYVEKTYQDAANGYRIWSPDSSGKRLCEQWGRTVKGTGNVDITLYKKYENISDYNAIATSKLMLILLLFQ